MIIKKKEEEDNDKEPVDINIQAYIDIVKEKDENYTDYFAGKPSRFRNVAIEDQILEVNKKFDKRKGSYPPED